MTESKHRSQGATSIARAFALFLLCYMVVQGMVGAILVHGSIGGIMEDLVRRDARSTLQSGVNYLNASITDKLSVLEAWSHSPELQAALSQKDENELAGLLSTWPLIDVHPCYELHEADGSLLLAMGNHCHFHDPVPGDFSALTKGEQASDVSVLTRHKGEAELAEWILSVPIRFDGRVQGVLSAHWPLSLHTALPDITSKRTKWELFHDDELVEAVGDGRADMISVATPTTFTGLSLSLGIGREVLSEYSWTLGVKLAVALVASTVCTVLLMYLLGRQLIVEPQRQLHAMSEELEEKNLALRREAAEKTQVVELLQFKSFQVEEKERLLRAVIEDQADLICRFTKGGLVTFANAAYTEFVGLEASEVENKARFLLREGEHREELARLLGGLDANSPIAGRTLETRDSGGTLHWIEWTFRILPPDKGGITEFQAVGHDVTVAQQLHMELERTNLELEGRVQDRTHELQAKNRELAGRIADRDRAEQEAKSQERLLRTILDGIKAGFFVLDRENGEVLACNEVAGKLLEIDTDTLVGSRCEGSLATLVGDAQNGICEPLSLVSRHSETRLPLPDGTAIPVERFVLDVDEQRMAVILFDISDRKNLERQLNVAQKMESIGVMASGIAHEINTPIQYTGDSVRFMGDGFEDLLQVYESQGRIVEAVRGEGSHPDMVEEVDELVEEADMEFLIEELPRAVERALEGVGRVATIVQAMKNFAHPGTENKKPVDLNAAIENTVVIAKNEWKYVADLNLNLDKELPTVICRPGDMNQVFLNIIVNAAHAIAPVVGDSGDKGAITVSTRLVGGMAEIRITDTGMGIPSENLNKVYDPFFTTKEVGKGTGQGLAIVHDIVVDKHGGSVDLESEVGKGTTFIVRVPLEPAPEAGGEEE